MALCVCVYIVIRLSCFPVVDCSLGNIPAFLSSGVQVAFTLGRQHGTVDEAERQAGASAEVEFGSSFKPFLREPVPSLLEGYSQGSTVSRRTPRGGYIVRAG